MTVVAFAFTVFEFTGHEAVYDTEITAPPATDAHTPLNDGKDAVHDWARADGSM